MCRLRLLCLVGVLCSLSFVVCGLFVVGLVCFVRCALFVVYVLIVVVVCSSPCVVSCWWFWALVVDWCYCLALWFVVD